MKSDQEKLVSEVERFLRKHKMVKTTFGRLALNDTAFVDRLMDDTKSHTTRTIDKVRAFMQEYTP